MTTEISPELKKKKIDLSSEQLNEILTAFKNGTVSIYHGIRTPHRSIVLETKRAEKESEWAHMFWMLADDLFEYDPELAAAFALRAVSKDDPANLQDDIYLSQLEIFRKNKDTIFGKQAALSPLQERGICLIDEFCEKGYVFAEVDAQKWFALQHAV